MKRKVEHPAPSERSLTGPRYWRSLDELAETPGFKAALSREFPDGASDASGVDRRQFMKIMAASFALGGVGLAGCRRPEEHILPFGKSVEGAVPGLPVYFATAMPMRNWAIPLLAETHQGRPTKLEGNPAYEPHGGASTLLAQASVLDLYDPDRATAHTQDGKAIDAAAVKALLASIGTKHMATQGEGLAFLAEASSSPTRARLTRILRAQHPKAIWAEYEPVSDEPPLAVARAIFGAGRTAMRPLYRFGAAKRIVSIDADFLQAESGSLYYAREFAKGRRIKKKDDPMNRLYVAESGLTLTGTMADHRLRLASSHMLAFAAALALKVTGDNLFAKAAEGLEIKEGWIAECAADLLANRSECLVVAGSHLPDAVHAIAYAINQFLGNVGSTVDFVFTTKAQTIGIGGLAEEITKGAVKTLVILGGNPVYNAPADLNWEKLQKSVPEVVRHGYYVDETSDAAGVHVAAAHYLESWGDARTVDGTVVPVQPMILPLFGGLTQNEVIASIVGLPTTDPYKLVYDTITGGAGPAGEAVFRKFLHDGVLDKTAFMTLRVRYSPVAVASYVAAAKAAPEVSSSAIEVRFVADARMDDGRFINNGWLQECPDPITKISWDNAIQVSPRLAKELKIDPPSDGLLQVARRDLAQFDKGRENAHIVELTIGGRTIKGPAHIQPGLANYTVIVPLGYGRTKTGRVGQGSGFNAYTARDSASPHIVTGVKIALTGERMELADSQWHWSMEGRDLVREGNLGEFQENPGFAKEVGLEAESPRAVLDPGMATMSPGDKASQIPRGNSLYVTPQFHGKQQWGMSIDLNTCIGCNACVVACQAENNIPIVGKEQVLRGRIMHWIRLDRYYSDGKASAGAFGDEGNVAIPEDPQISVQPIACMQCELAPCETVCPVNATVHDDEGLNVMAYNRCIGTRYCANNCPYKVRRFNFFDWNMRQLDSLYLGPVGPEGMPELVQMVKNPEVTIRMRGVMEKCTYCVQRIEHGKISWKVKVAQEGHPEDVIVPDGTIKTACQQACPVESIVFGDIMDPNSAVSQAKAREQDYSLLGYLNTRPRTTYLARLRNPNPKMPDYTELPLSRVENWNKNHPPKA
jgi:molybdopterin-containing oxidoreductase family iron-sulfur binding subunit